MDLTDVLVGIAWFMLLVAWIWLLIAILSDIFRDHDLSGMAKAGWTFALIVVPWLGALLYLVVRGGSMNERALAQAQRNEQAFQQYVQQTASAGAPSTADELAKLTDLRDRGAITAQEYEQAKSKVLGDQPTATTPQQREHRSATTTA